jgi:N-acetylglucosamine malate deacetylase 2
VAGGRTSSLSAVRSVLAVCAHPDDESFGLGAVLDHLVRQGARAAVLCFTHGEASTLGATVGDLGELRRRELQDAARELGVGDVVLLDHPDGGLADVPLDVLTGAVDATARRVGADLLLVFDEGGITGHPDHRRATEAALAAAGGRPVLAWALPARVAIALSSETGVAFVGRDEDELDVTLAVERSRQRRAVACHTSQSTGNHVLARRLELLGDSEVLRWLKPPREPA